MDEKLALEMAYKNGYEQGVKGLAERLKKFATKVEGGKGFEGVFVMANNFQIDTISEELLKERAKG